MTAYEPYETIPSNALIKFSPTKAYINHNAIIIQRFIRNNFKYKKFKSWINSKNFVEWFYHPNNIGGKYHKKSMEKILS